MVKLVVINMKPAKQNQAKLKQSTTKSNVFSEGDILFFKSHKIASSKLKTAIAYWHH